jgi:hypothetical protein
MPPGLRLRQPQNPVGTSETAAAAPGAQQPINPAVRRIASFLNSYDGGDCFLIVPLKIAEGDTQIEVYGGSRAPFTALDGEFARENGFRAGISWHQVTEAQCGAVNFVRRLRNQSGTARRLDNRTETLASGSILSGTVGGFGGDNLELLLVGAEAASPTPRRCTNERWRSRRKRSVPIIRRSHLCWAGWAAFIHCEIAPTTPRRCYNERWRSRRKGSVPIIRT